MSDLEQPAASPADLLGPDSQGTDATVTDGSSGVQWVTLALLKRPQGRRGELLAELLTDFPDRFLAQPDVFLAAPGFQGAPAEARAATVRSCWLPVGRNQGRVVLGFAGIDSINDAETLNGLEVIVPESARLDLPEDETYISDLTGCEVYAAEGDEAARELIGVVEDVEFPTTADGSRRLEDAAPLLIVRGPAGEEHLIPYVKHFIVRLSTEERRLDMTLPAGLLALNLPAEGR